MTVDISSEDFSARSAGFTGDDMVDPKGWLEEGSLRDPLSRCRSMLLEPYQELDARAQKDQGRHFILAVVVSLLAAFAIAMALAFLGYRVIWKIDKSTLASHVLTWIEGLAGVGAVLVVLVGVWTAYHRAWLLNRYKAERLRYAKFHFLTSPDVWLPSRKQKAIAELKDTIQQIRGHGIRDVETWLRTDKAPRPPDILRDVDLSGNTAAIRELRCFYRDTRLAAQLDYLSRKAETRSHRHEIFAQAPQLLFFVTAAIILLHFTLEFLGEDAPVLTVALVLGAVLLPAVGAMLRTIFAASEMGRNATRSSAKWKALDEMCAPIREEDDPRAILHNLWLCEYIIESDHREWLRLMIDAEWFG